MKRTVTEVILQYTRTSNCNTFNNHIRILLEALLDKDREIDMNNKIYNEQCEERKIQKEKRLVYYD